MTKSEKAKAFSVEAKIYSITNASGIKSTDVRGCLNTLEDGIAIEIPEICDLALIHRVNSNRVYVLNSSVVFTTMVCNQGTTVAFGFDITNYKNQEFDFDPLLNSGWVHFT